MSVTGFGGGGKGGRRGRNGDLLKPEINQVWGNLQIRKSNEEIRKFVKF
jgi:hypothetical protein